jgi:hypothetical protein
MPGRHRGIVSQFRQMPTVLRQELSGSSASPASGPVQLLAPSLEWLLVAPRQRTGKRTRVCTAVADHREHSQLEQPPQHAVQKRHSHAPRTTRHQR